MEAHANPRAPAAEVADTPRARQPTGGKHELGHPTILQTDDDELVPSRYALKVGDIDMLVISDGVLSLPTKVLVATADPAARQ
jgi:hypothetical protein